MTSQQLDAKGQARRRLLAVADGAVVLAAAPAPVAQPERQVLVKHQRVFARASAGAHVPSRSWKGRTAGKTSPALQIYFRVLPKNPSILAQASAAAS